MVSLTHSSPLFFDVTRFGPWGQGIRITGSRSIRRRRSFEPALRGSSSSGRGAEWTRLRQSPGAHRWSRSRRPGEHEAWWVLEVRAELPHGTGPSLEAV